MDERNIKLILSYDGTAYCGWQVQPDRISIQGTIQEVLATILRENVKLIGAGRTDAGVHAVAQVANFRTSNSIAPPRLHKGLNALLPSDIRASEVAEVPLEFHAQHAAREKHYRYTIVNADFVSPFVSRYAWLVPGHLDFEDIRLATRCLLGEHDFSSFAASGGSAKNNVRRITRIEVGTGGLIGLPHGDDSAYHLDFWGTGFLYKMIRSIVGTLVEVGRGKLAPEDLIEVLRGTDRTLAGPTAPPRGLCLVGVSFD